MLGGAPVKRATEHLTPTIVLLNTLRGNQIRFPTRADNATRHGCSACESERGNTVARAPESARQT